MNDSWNDMKRAKEEEFFSRQNQEALSRIKERSGTARISPVSGKPMEQVTIQGVVVDRCPESGGIWLDSGELEQIVTAMKNSTSDEKESGDWFSGFFESLFRGK